MKRFVALGTAAVAVTAALVVTVPASAALTPGPTPSLSSVVSVPKAFKCTYQVSATWPGGFIANLTIANNGPDISSWVTKWTFKNPTQLINGWTSVVTQFGPYQVIIGNAAWNGLIKTGQATTFGWTASAAATEVPTDITVNGVPC
jgi:hypothetical protein